MAKGGPSSAPSESIIPEAVLDSVNTTLCSLKQLKPQLMQLVTLAKDPHMLSQMRPLQRAQPYFLLAKATTTLLAVRLRCAGVDLDWHPINSDLEALSLYDFKVKKLQDLNKGPCQPSTVLNQQAAARFIEHSLPDLTAEQRQSLKEISKGERPRMNYIERASQKRRKCRHLGSPSIQAAVRGFLEKAVKELMGENISGFKGPCWTYPTMTRVGKIGRTGKMRSSRA